MKTNEFLDIFGKDNWIQTFDDSGKKRKNLTFEGSRNTFDFDMVKKINDAGAGIFFTPNSFKDRRVKENCKKINAWFFEIDDIPKNEQASLIERSPVCPSLVVESKNSYHVYFLAEDGTIENFERIQRSLIKYFNSDRAIKDSTRVMRLPGYNHMKGDPFPVKIVSNHGFKHTEKTMINNFPYEEEAKEEKEIPIKPDNEDEMTLWDHTFWIDCKTALERLSGSSWVRQEIYSFKPRSQGGYHIFVNGKAANAWLDLNGRIASPEDVNGGPSIIQWLKYMGWDKKDIYRIIKRELRDLIPEKAFEHKKEEKKIEDLSIPQIDSIFEELRNLRFDVVKTIPEIDTHRIFIRGNVTRIGAFSNTGKSNFAYWITAKMLEQGYKGAVFSTEVIKPIVLARMVQHFDGTYFWDLINKKATPTEEARHNVRNLTIFDSTDGVNYLEQIENIISNHKNLDFIMVDFCQDIKDKQKSKDLFMRMSEYAIEIQDMAKKYNICIIDLSQVANEEVSQKNTYKEKSGFTSLKGSGDLFSKADIVLSLQRDRTVENSPMEVKIRKHKYGMTGDFEMDVDFRRIDFSNFRKSENNFSFDN